MRAGVSLLAAFSRKSKTPATFSEKGKTCIFLIIIQAANDAREFIEKAKVFARKHFAEHDPKVIVRNADAYEPREHEHADVVITTDRYEELIDAYEERDTRV